MCRDLKAENVLLGADGAWKLCDFGSVSTNHKCFDKPEEMGIEEDNIRKHTTPAYRAPEVYILKISILNRFSACSTYLPIVCLFADCRCGTCTEERLSVRK